MKPKDEAIEIIDAITENTMIKVFKPNIIKPKKDKKLKVFQHLQKTQLSWVKLLKEFLVAKLLF